MHKIIFLSVSDKHPVVVSDKHPVVVYLFTFANHRAVTKGSRYWKQISRSGNLLKATNIHIQILRADI